MTGNIDYDFGLSARDLFAHCELMRDCPRLDCVADCFINNFRLLIFLGSALSFMVCERSASTRNGMHGKLEFPRRNQFRRSNARNWREMQTKSIFTCFWMADNESSRIGWCWLLVHVTCVEFNHFIYNCACVARALMCHKSNSHFLRCMAILRAEPCQFSSE